MKEREHVEGNEGGKKWRKGGMERRNGGSYRRERINGEKKWKKREKERMKIEGHYLVQFSSQYIFVSLFVSR